MARRFIAGAICPSCGKQDKLVLDTVAERLECVSCDFAEQRPQDPAPDEGEVVKILEPENRTTLRNSG